MFGFSVQLAVATCYVFELSIDKESHVVVLNSLCSVRYQSTDPRQNGIYLFYTITKTFQHIS